MKGDSDHMMSVIGAGVMQQLTTTDLIERARAHKMTPDERRDQRISLVMGMRGKSSTLTREKVTTILSEVEGLIA